jgi:hypothetical protein
LGNVTFQIAQENKNITNVKRVIDLDNIISSQDLFYLETEFKMSKPLIIHIIVKDLDKELKESSEKTKEDVRVEDYLPFYKRKNTSTLFGRYRM